MKTLSLCMIVKNEEKVIGRCLESVKELVDEMIVVDTGSTDSTIQIARNMGAKVYKYTWNKSFSDARNFSLEKSSSDWNIVLDADEYIISAQKVHVEDFINSENSIGRIEIINKFKQDDNICYSRAFVSRIFPKGVKFQGRIHEQLVSDFSRKHISIKVEHDGYFLKDKYERNIKLLEEELKYNPKDSFYLYYLGNEYRGIKEYSRANYFYRDCYNNSEGNEGYYPNLVVNYLYSLKDSGNLEEGYRIIKENKLRLMDFPDFHFISGLLYMDLIFSNIQKYSNLLLEIEKSYLKCIEIGETKTYNGVIGTGSFIASYNLGVYYETTGNIDKAKKFYELSAKKNYEPAINRLSKL